MHGTRTLTLYCWKHCNLHVYLVCSISSYHVLYHQATAWVLVLPGIQSEDGVLREDDAVTAGDKAFDFSPGPDTSVVHGDVGNVRRRGERTTKNCRQNEQ